MFAGQTLHCCSEGIHQRSTLHGVHWTLFTGYCVNSVLNSCEFNQLQAWPPGLIIARLWWWKPAVESFAIAIMGRFLSWIKIDSWNSIISRVLSSSTSYREPGIRPVLRVRGSDVDRTTSTEYPVGALEKLNLDAFGYEPIWSDTWSYRLDKRSISLGCLY